jgi:hypothetical protein
MSPRRALPSVLLCALALGACAGDKQGYPSLSIRPAERVSATYTPAAPAPEPAPPAPSAGALGQAAKLRADAADANRRFEAAAQAAQAPVNAARGAAPGSEQWSVAQVALADAEARHNETVAALASLDSIQVAAQTEGSALGDIETAVAEVSALADAESRRLDTLMAAIGG